MSSELTFINFSGSPQHGNTSNSKTVRSHVMKKYRQERKAEKRNKTSLGRYKVPFYDTGIFSKSGNIKEVPPQTEHLTFEASLSLKSFTRTASTPGTEDSSKIEEIERPEIVYGSQSSSNIVPLSFLDSGLNAYNFLPISASPRVVMLLHTSMSGTFTSSS